MIEALKRNAFANDARTTAPFFFVWLTNVRPIRFACFDQLLNQHGDALPDRFVVDTRKLLPVTLVVTSDGGISKEFLGWNPIETTPRLRAAIEETLARTDARQ